jgi:hypothetical protein
MTRFLNGADSIVHAVNNVTGLKRQTDVLRGERILIV